ncbi:putative sensor-like histidine kinase [Streptomyces sp. HCCB10043]|nr:putative sensor-like histidine kinase [Streptomyces sp. HCCB10043]
MRPAGPVPLPRRTPPTLVTDRGRRVDAQGDDALTPPAKATGPVPHTADRTPDEADGPRTTDAPWTVRAAAHRGVPGVSRTPDTSGTPDATRATVAPGSGREEAPPAPDTIGGLPRRVRQASLARQLREESAERTVQRAPVDTVDDAERDADEVRDRMASLQRGWQRGRRENAETTENTASTGTTENTGAPGNAASVTTTDTTETTEETANTGDSGGTAPGTTPGGDGR